MDLYANKKFKITRNALTREDTLIVREKHLDKNKEFNLKKGFLNKNFYSTKSQNSSQKEDNYLSYIIPLKQVKPRCKVIPLVELDKRYFSAMV